MIKRISVITDHPHSFAFSGIKSSVFTHTLTHKDGEVEPEDPYCHI